MTQIYSKISAFLLLTTLLSACGVVKSTSPASDLVNTSAETSKTLAFTASNPEFSSNNLLVGNLPNNDQNPGSYGEVSVVPSDQNTYSNTVQFQEEPSGDNGKLNLAGSLVFVHGTIQLSDVLIQTIENEYGPQAQITSLAFSASQGLVQDTDVTYLSYLYGVKVYFYINGNSTPIGPYQF